MTTRRVEKAQDLIQQEVSRLLLFKSKDPRLEGVNVTGVRMTGDLRRAHVMYSVFDDRADRPAIQGCLERAASFFRREVGQALAWKHTPELVFEYDGSLAYGQSIERVLSTLNIRPENETGEDAAEPSADEPDQGDDEDDKDEAGEGPEGEGHDPAA